MNRQTGPAAPMLIGLLAASPSGSDAANRAYPGFDAAQAEVWQPIERWNAALSSNDPEAYFGFIDPAVTVLTPRNPYRVEGLRDAVRSMLRKIAKLSADRPPRSMRDQLAHQRPGQIEYRAAIALLARVADGIGFTRAT